jgi:hypothetical protein
MSLILPPLCSPAPPISPTAAAVTNAIRWGNGYVHHDIDRARRPAPGSTSTCLGCGIVYNQANRYKATHLAGCTGTKWDK